MGALPACTMTRKPLVSNLGRTSRSFVPGPRQARRVAKGLKPHRRRQHWIRLVVVLVLVVLVVVLVLVLVVVVGGGGGGGCGGGGGGGI